ncbi:hypothetical protein GCM10010244_76900 [Streptomyces coeruleorubidus]|nr:hypothetical protein GCM10010244_76900 [Streptomyces bellus]
MRGRERGRVKGCPDRVRLHRGARAAAGRIPGWQRVLTHHSRASHVRRERHMSPAWAAREGKRSPRCQGENSDERHSTPVRHDSSQEERRSDGYDSDKGCG